MTPLSHLKGVCTNDTCIRFMMRRKNAGILFQWEPFKGVITENGVSHLSINQSITNLPLYPINFPIKVIHNGAHRLGLLEINPFDCIAKIKFMLDFSCSPCANCGDNIVIPGSCVQGITC